MLLTKLESVEVEASKTKVVFFAPDVGEIEILGVGARLLRTLSALAAEADPPDVVTVTVRAPADAPAATEKRTLICVELVALTLCTVIPSPRFTEAPVKLVPVICPSTFSC